MENEFKNIPEKMLRDMLDKRADILSSLITHCPTEMEGKCAIVRVDADSFSNIIEDKGKELREYITDIVKMQIAVCVLVNDGIFEMYRNTQCSSKLDDECELHKVINIFADKVHKIDEVLSTRTFDA